MNTVTNEDIEVLQAIWHDHFTNALPPSQFAVPLRLHPIDTKILVQKLL